MLAGAGWFLLQGSGRGLLIVAAYGGLREISLEDDQTLPIDSGHLVACSDTVNIHARAIGGLMPMLVSGEGVVIDLAGPGRVLFQTRNEDELTRWLGTKLQNLTKGKDNE